MKFNSKTVEIGGDKYTIKEISAKERKQIFVIVRGDDPTDAEAHAIKMGCAQFADKTIDEIYEMPGTIFAILAKEVMTISGLGDDSETEKNS